MRGARCAARKDTEAGTCRWSCRQRWTGAAAASAAAAPCPGQILPADLTTAHVQAMFTAINRQHEAMGRPVTDLGSGTAFISWQLRHYDGHVVLCPPKTARASGSSRWTAPPSPPCLSTGHASSPSAPRPARTTSAAARCLPGPTGTPWLLTGSRVTFADSTEASGPPIRLHDLRHGAASLALAAGADLKVVQDMLGHSGIVLTAGTYTSVLPQVARKVAEDIACLIIAAGCLSRVRNRAGAPPGGSCAMMSAP